MRMARSAPRSPMVNHGQRVNQRKHASADLDETRFGRGQEDPARRAISRQLRARESGFKVIVPAISDVLHVLSSNRRHLVTARAYGIAVANGMPHRF